ncbi:hypothetical protein OsJ_24478 [Oryza sativa Japonica Group]|uniref:Uncharacterized protein n=3 Tax=Oryza sativa subsp. japonica TaxID=39947 RepID=A3BKF1_ORYSJ|nr:hypothetical protein OsJ_24478 [Oryza sativa Japonica Group]
MQFEEIKAERKGQEKGLKAQFLNEEIFSSQIMPCAAAELANGEAAAAAACAVKVGTTGTIGSLMTRELEAIKAAPPHATAAATTPRRLRRQSSPVSVPCGASPRKIAALRKSSSSLSTTSSGGGSGRRTDRVSAEESSACKTAACRRSSSTTPASSPMLAADVDRSGGGGKAKKAAARGRRGVGGVEVVDVRCGNPMSSRLRRLGFSKLSETFA